MGNDWVRKRGKRVSEAGGKGVGGGSGESERWGYFKSRENSTVGGNWGRRIQNEETWD